MKRKLLCTLLCLLFVLCAFAPAVSAETLNSEDVDWGITMTAENVTPTGAVVVVSQSGGNHAGNLEYGSAYRVEVWKENAWHRLPYIRENVAWTMMAYGLPENKVTRWEVDWLNLYGELAPGRYRFVKNFMDFCEDSNDDANFYAEFVIGDPSVASNETVYRVVGNADWLGNWDAAFEGGRMIEVSEGLYRKDFEDVPPGTYEIKITKDGKWDDAYGNNGRNFCFTVYQSGTATVDFRLNGDAGIIQVYGDLGRWDDDEEDQKQEENPKSADLPLSLPIALLLFSAAAAPMLLTKRKETQ